MWRGYNQSEIFAQGLSQSMNKPVLNVLERKVFTDTQTKKETLERHENMEEIFQIKKNSLKQYHKHILLVDDVMTTGATLESCARVLIENGYEVSLATMAIAIS
jgi:ComF family protein